MGMRRGNQPSLVIDGDTLVGVTLGSDFTAEHEWGIDELLKKFRVNISKIGTEGRRIHAHPVAWMEHEKLKGFTSWFSDWNNQPIPPEHVLSVAEIRSPNKINGKTYNDQLQAGWDGSDFAVFSANEEDQRHLRVIYDHILSDDAIIMLGGARLPAFDNPGLVIGILSRLPDDVRKNLKESDLNAIRLRDAMAATGIEEKLKAAGRRYHALSPRFDKDGALIFWLNPRDQQDNNFGWFKLSDLEQWIDGKGPIPIAEKAGLKQ